MSNKEKEAKLSGSKFTLSLGQIFLSKEVWMVVAKFPKSPRISYKIAIYLEDLEKHWKVVEQQRTAYITQYGTTDSNGNVSINPKTNKDGFDNFVKSFNEYLAVETSLDKLDMSMYEFVEAISANKDNAIDELSLLSIKMFFK